jgi:hypothetical protein
VKDGAAGGPVGEARQQGFAIALETVRLTIKTEPF